MFGRVLLGLRVMMLRHQLLFQVEVHSCMLDDVVEHLGAKVLAFAVLHGVRQQIEEFGQLLMVGVHPRVSDLECVVSRNPVHGPLLQYMQLLTLASEESCSFYYLSLIHISEPTRLGMIS